MCGGNNPPPPPPPQAHSIILVVDTANIPATTDPPASPPINVDQWCSFEGQSNGVTNENFQIDVKNGDSVTWSGTPKSVAADSIIVTEIDYESGTNLFGTSDLYRASGASTVTGTIVNGSNADVETYTIKFNVYQDGIFRGSYQIDPKIRMNN